MLALPGFPGRPSIVLPLRNMPVACFRQKKPPTFVGGLLCWHYLASWAGQRIVPPLKQSGGLFQADQTISSK